MTLDHSSHLRPASAQDIKTYKGRFILALGLRVVQDSEAVNGEVARPGTGPLSAVYRGPM